MKCVSVSVSREVSGRICEWKMLPRNVFMALNCLLLFTQNLLLLHQQLVIVLVARVRLLWILEIQLRRRRHRRRFHPHWLFPHSAESWFEILLRFIPRFTEALNNVPRENTRGKSYGHVLFVIHMLQNLMTQWRMDVKEQRIFSPDKIFTASKASQRN